MKPCKHKREPSFWVCKKVGDEIQTLCTICGGRVKIEFEEREDEDRETYTCTECGKQEVLTFR